MSRVLTVEKLLFVELYFRYHFRADLLAKKAGVHNQVVYDMMLNKLPVKLSDALKVLYTLSRLYGQNYSLQNVLVKVYG